MSASYVSSKNIHSYRCLGLLRQSAKNAEKFEKFQNLFFYWLTVELFSVGEINSKSEMFSDSANGFDMMELKKNVCSLTWCC